MKEITITVSDFGKNCQHPFSELVRTACQFQSRILLSCEGRQVNAKSIMGIMAFNPTKGMSIDIVTDGDDEKEALHAIEKFLVCE